MFYVRHHDDKVQMFNANCQAAVMISHLKATLKMPSASYIDLLPYPVAADKPAAPVGMNDRPLDQYCDQFLQLRSHYILLQAKPPPGGYDAVADELNTPGAMGGSLVGTANGERNGSAGAGGPHGAGSSITSAREMILVWQSPKPEETERIALALAQRAFEAKKPATKKGGGKK
eukprot:GILI01016228.1.p1 GENE.GILI01016228.1~~GILI01016228.1.p1  ORF type:complete len:184 (-),score=30.12 GILI01016228.1:70-591(-)